MKKILQKINQRFELNFVFVLQFSEHEEDYTNYNISIIINIIQIMQVYVSESGTSSGHQVAPLSLVIQGFKTTWLTFLGFLMFSGGKEK